MTINRWLGSGALALGALAAVAGSPAQSTPGQIDVAELASMVVREQDHVDAIDLAQWIREQKSGLRVLDLRTPAEFEEYHVPTAVNVPIESLTRTQFSDRDTVVMYSQGGAHAAQAWVFVRALGVKNVFFLSGGLDEWAAGVMNPVLPDDATPEEKKAFEKVVDVSRYFGGTPHIGPRGSDTKSTAAESLARLKRRGC